MYVCICNSSLLGNKVPIDPTKNDLSTLFATYFWCSTAVIDRNWSNILFFTRLYAFFLSIFYPLRLNSTALTRWSENCPSVRTSTRQVKTRFKTFIQHSNMCETIRMVKE